MVSITLRVLSKPDPSKLPFIYRRLGKGKLSLKPVSHGTLNIAGMVCASQQHRHYISGKRHYSARYDPALLRGTIVNRTKYC